MDWFEIRQVNRDLWMIVEPGHVVSWLYLGSDSAALIDSGTGIAPIRPVVEKLTRLPIKLINTHYHFDHVGGNAEFAVRLAGAQAEAPLRRHAPRDLLKRYIDGLLPLIADAEAQRAADADVMALTPELALRPFPAGFDAESWRPGGVAATGLLREGDEIDLGDRRLQVIETPGHSPDGISLFDPAHGVLFVGDTLTEGALYAHYDESSLDDLAVSVGKLTRLPAPVHAICAGHVARAIAEVSLIAETEAALKQVASGAPYRQGQDIFGYGLRETRHGRVWVYHSDGRASSFPLHD
ncbi:MBL fold metallo-hydrolase [Acidisoma silvae]|nr:MBL fold metallo-hydrolase [Acidisoma silvae]